MYPNTTHTHSECRECFGVWKVLGLCKNKLVTFGNAIRQYYRIWEASKDKVSEVRLVYVFVLEEEG